MKNIITLIAVFSLTLITFNGLTGCNAVEGLGEDLKEASENTKEAFSDD